MENSWVHSQFKFWSVHILLLLSICTSPTKSPPPTHTACRRLSESNCLISTSLRERRKHSRNKNTNDFSLFRLGPESKAQAGDKIIPFERSTWGDGTRASQWRHPHAAPPTQLPWPLTQAPDKCFTETSVHKFSFRWGYISKCKVNGFLVTSFGHSGFPVIKQDFFSYLFRVGGGKIFQ